MASELTYDTVEGEKWSPKLVCILQDWDSDFSEHFQKTEIYSTAEINKTSCFSLTLFCHSVIFSTNWHHYVSPLEIVTRKSHTVISLIVYITLITWFVAGSCHAPHVEELSWCFELRRKWISKKHTVDRWISHLPWTHPKPHPYVSEWLVLILCV